MRKFVLLAVATAALCVPAVSAAGRPTAAQLATKMCGSLRAQEGKSTFKMAYHSFAACSKTEKSQAKSDVTNAAKSCRAEQAADPAAFKAKYGTNLNSKGKGAGANAFGKCVSALAKQNATSDVSDSVSAAKTCKSMMASDLAGFQATYGKDKNAFGKCVAKQSSATTT
jgi:hypothetical protein